MARASQTTAPGDKAVTTANSSEFKRGRKPGTGSNPKVSENPRTTGSFSGSSKQPLNKGSRDKHYHAQAVPKIPRSKQMNSGT